ncbi:MAG: SLC13 family permease [Hyphomicrobiaceae bacterium]
MTFTLPQLTVVGLLATVLVLLVWGRLRYDLVAFGALIAAVVLGVVPGDKAFAGFGHPATVIIALVLVVSHGLAASGAIDILARAILRAGSSVSTHIMTVSGVGALLSAFMNNVGALALLMPLDIEAARKAGRSPALTLMPLSFATILGGLVTLIGTPPNIIVSTFRERALGEPFAMFDYAPVGLACALAGVAFVALVGWRLIPQPTGERVAGSEPFKLDDYIAELSVVAGSGMDGMPLAEIEELAGEAEIAVLAVIRDHQRLPHAAGWLKAQDGDVLLIEAAADRLDKFAGEHKLAYVHKDRHQAEIDEAELELIEVVVRPGATIEGRTSASLQLVDRYGVWLVGISRQGRRLGTRVRRTQIQAGDVLLMLMPSSRVGLFVETTGVLPLRERGLEVQDRRRAVLAGGVFAAAIALSSFGLIYLPVALGLVALVYVLIGIVPLRQLYETIEWPVVVLIGSLIPIGAALETSGATGVLAKGIVDLATGLPSWAVLTVVMALTMTLSDVLNNTATALVAAPIAVEVANKLGANPDAFLMAVAVAASCAFLTPIGHKNNTLIMGPGGYGFGDYWRLGLPLELIVVAVGVPMILLVWPL